MARDAKDNIIYKYCNTIMHLKSAKRFVDDINTLNYCLENFSAQLATNVLKKLVHKYQKNIDDFGEKFTGILTVNDIQIYSKKTEEDLVFELLYLQRLIIIFAAIYVGIEKDIDSVIEKIEKDNIDITSINLYY